MTYAHRSGLGIRGMERADMTLEEIEVVRLESNGTLEWN